MIENKMLFYKECSMHGKSLDKNLDTRSSNTDLWLQFIGSNVEFLSCSNFKNKYLIEKCSCFMDVTRIEKDESLGIL